MSAQHTAKTAVSTGIALIFLFFALPCLATAPSLDGLYDRLAADLKAGKPLMIEVHVALCDNDSQGIIPVKNRSICNGDDPEQNMYWASSGGLRGVMKKNGWKKVSDDRSNGDILQTVVWTKRMRAGGALQERGVKGMIDARLTGYAWRGSRIHDAMKNWIKAVHEDRRESTAHLIGYVGHDYFMDVSGDRQDDLMSAAKNRVTPAVGVFALSCTGDHFIRPAIRNENAFVLALNRYFTFPHAATIDGIALGITEGLSVKKLHHRYARRFSEAQNTGMSWALKTFAIGP